MGINGVNQRAEFLRQRQRLPAGATPRVDDNAKLLLRKQPQDVQCRDVVTRPEFLQTAEEQIDRIGVVNDRGNSTQ